MRIAGEKFGLAFQIADDIADKGKERVNILSVVSPKSAKEKIKSLIDSANTSLSIFGDRAETLKLLIEEVKRHKEKF